MVTLSKKFPLVYATSFKLDTRRTYPFMPSGPLSYPFTLPSHALPLPARFPPFPCLVPLNGRFSSPTNWCPVMLW